MKTEGTLKQKSADGRQLRLDIAALSPSNSPSIPLSARSNNMKRSAQLVPRKALPVIR